MSLPGSPRTERMEKIYQVDKQIGQTMPLKDEPTIQEYNHWRIIENRYPGDLILSKHDMLLPKREAKLEDLTATELMELPQILKELEEEYHLVMWNFPPRQTKPGHFHVHLARYKKRS